MLTETELEELAEFTMVGGATMRLYPSVPVDADLRADAMIVNEHSLIGIEGFGDLSYPRKDMGRLCRSSEHLFDSTYRLSDWSHRDASLTPGWGMIERWGNELYVVRDCNPLPTEPWRQLNLLWKEELHDIIATLKREPLPANAPKAELIGRILAPIFARSADRRGTLESIHSLVVDALLHRDYEKIGREDYTFNQAGGEMQRVFGWKNPAPRSMFRNENGWMAELWDDPALRADAVQDMPRPANPTAWVRSRAAELIKSWKSRGITVNKTMQERLVASLLSETASLPVPERRVSISADTGSAAADEAVAKHPEGWVSWKDIRAVPGVPWISVEIIDEFARFIAAGKTRRSLVWDEEGVAYSPVTGRWVVRSGDPTAWTNVNYARLDSMFGVPGYNGLRILESILNLRQPKLSSEEKTLAVLDKQELILEVFEKWLWDDPVRRAQVEESYNKMFSAFQTEPADGSDLEFPGMSQDLELFPYQKNAVAKILSENNTLLAFDTGAGKTYIMIAAAMKLRQARKSRKNMFVVPNNIVGQWEQMFLNMYPDARLLVIDPAHFKPEMRGRVLDKIKYEDYDGIIIAYSCLEQVPLSAKWITQRTKALKAKINAENRSQKYEYRGFTTMKTQQKNVKDNIDAEAKKLLKMAEKAPAGQRCFDELGITGIFLDEAHNYKNVPVRTSLGAIGGINPTGSAKCLAMINKVRCVQDSRAGHGAVLATATPLSNSLADAFVMQQYVQPRELSEIHLDSFDSWVKSFARPELVCEIDVDTSRFRYVKRLARFYNIPELSRMFSYTTAFHAMDAVEEDLPDLKGYTNVLINRGAGLRSFMDSLVQRTERIRNHEVPPEFDNMLKVSTEGRLAALDLRLVGLKQPYDEHSKIHACVESVMDIYNKNKGCTQIVFCDYSTPKADSFNVYDDLRKHFIEAGVPDGEIAFIHSFTTEPRKLELYRKVNAGEVRILIGSTFKLGIGTNVQTRLKAVHHLDIPWRPADMVQREGRILRKGNRNATIKIVRYISEGSFDAYSWQILERKQTFISQFLAGTAYERSASDLEDTVLTYAQVKSLAINEPLMKDLAEKENELRRLRMLASNYVQTVAERNETLEKLRRDMQTLKKHTEATKNNAEYAKELADDDVKATYKKYRDLLCPEVLDGRAAPIERSISVLGFAVTIPPASEQSAKHLHVTISREDAEYRIKMGESSSGNLRRIVNFIRRLDQEVERLEKQASDLAAKIQGNETALAEGNPYPSQIQKLQGDIAELRDKIIARQSGEEIEAAI